MTADAAPAPVPGQPAPSITRLECPIEGHGSRPIRLNDSDVPRCGRYHHGRRCRRALVEVTYVPLAALEAMTAERDEARELSMRLPRTDDYGYDLRQRLNRAVRWLREAEDIARIEVPVWPTADRIRSIYEQVTADVLEGKTTVPPMAQRLREAEAKLEALRVTLTVVGDTLSTIASMEVQRHPERVRQMAATAEAALSAALGTEEERRDG